MTKKLLCIVILSFMLVCLFTSCDIINFHTHNYGEWQTVKTATCVEYGINERYCECGDRQTQTIYALGHQYGEWVITEVATCTEIGSKERYCECGDKQTQNISATGHQYSEWVITKEVTCTEDGSKERYCECGEKESEIIAMSHNYVSGVCSYCNRRLINLILPETPVMVSSSLSSGHIESTIKIIEIGIESISQRYDGSYDIVLYYSYEQMHTDKVGDITIQCIFKLCDSDGYVVFNESNYMRTLAVGEKARDHISFSINDSNLTYTFMILDFKY